MEEWKSGRAEEWRIRSGASTLPFFHSSTQGRLPLSPSPRLTVDPVGDAAHFVPGGSHVAGHVAFHDRVFGGAHGAAKLPGGPAGVRIVAPLHQEPEGTRLAGVGAGEHDRPELV